jgi:hypothetical protein
MGELSRSGDLELAQDLEFERRSWTIERIGWVVMAIVGLAALAGLLGPGPFSNTIAGEPDRPLWLEYSRFGRFSAPLTLRVHLGPSAGQHRLARIWLRRAYLEGIQVERVTPHAAEVEAGPEQLTYVFPVRDPSREMAVTFSLKAQQIGRQHGCVGLGDGPPLCFRQFIYP